MAISKLDRVLQEVKGLSPEELRRVREVVDSILKSATLPPGDQALQEKLLEEGLVSEIKPSIRDLKGNRKLIKSKGKPLSEIIIEERR
jgi:hypothetical protein